MSKFILVILLKCFVRDVFAFKKEWGSIDSELF
jgi:hypothetical protein